MIRRPGILARLTIFLLPALTSTNPNAEPEIDPAGLALAEQLATCAAYYFNATNANPISDYEVLYEAGEKAMNRLRRIVDREQAGRLVGDASMVMTTLTGGDWRQFEQVELRYAVRCAALGGSER